MARGEESKSVDEMTMAELRAKASELAKHEPSDVDAMGLDKRRGVIGKRYGAGFVRQATVYGAALAVIVAILIGGKIAIDELDQGPEVNADEAPWAQPDAPQHTPAPIDFPRNPSP